MHNPAQDPNPTLPSPRQSPTQIRVLAVAIIATASAIIWPAGDLLYQGTWTSPGPWWILVLVGLAAWITYVTCCGQERILAGQRQILARMDEIEQDVADYGDRRESNGHAIAVQIRSNGHGQGQGRLLNPVE